VPAPLHSGINPVAVKRHGFARQNPTADVLDYVSKGIESRRGSTAAVGDMVWFRVKTTLNIDDEIMWRLQEEAARRRTTISALVEAGLRCVLVAPPAVTGERIAPLPPLPRWDSGGKLISIDDRDELYRALEAK